MTTRRYRHLTLAGAIMTLLALVPTASLLAASARTVWEPDSHVTTALLREDWATVARLLGADARLPAVAKLMKAHAELALNQNNASACLFLQATAEDMQQWADWSQYFTQQHPDAAIAYYFRGDAFARLQQWDAALDAFDHALRLRPNHPLVLNARGVVYAILGQWDQAVLDLAQASETRPSLADGYANRSTLYVHKKEGAEGAWQWANRALALTPDFVLALNSRGSAAFALARWADAQHDFSTAEHTTPCLGPLVADNVTSIVAYMNGQQDHTQLALLTDEEAGTTLDRRFEALQQDPSQWNTNRFVSALRSESPEVQRQYMDRLKDVGARNTDAGQRISQNLNRITDWDRSRGLGELFSRLIPQSFGVSTPRGGANGGGLTVQQQQREVTRGNFDTATRLQESLTGSRPPVGGVTTSLERVYIDAGEWPFVAQYGLLYRITAQEPSGNK
ncbi:MAG: tetratricopeptide repeat protein [Deltaproteobacteria bacterium]|nr:tetratricopeptide repeat protein [Deltaproteobacteria bacterium]